MAKKQQPSGKPKEAPRVNEPAELYRLAMAILLEVKKIVTDSDVVLSESRKALAQTTERLEEMRVIREPFRSATAIATMEQFREAGELHFASVMREEIEGYLKFHVEEVRDWLRIGDLVKQYLQENPEWLRRPAEQVTERKACGAHYQGASCQLRLGHEGWHGDITAVKYWPPERSEAPGAAPAPGSGK